MKPWLRWLGLVALAGLALQLYFLSRIALMLWLNPQSTAFQRSEAWRLNMTQASGTAKSPRAAPWRQQWVPYQAISDQLKRAVIASEDGEFALHDGVDWEALEKAWQKNAQAQEQAARKGQAATKIGKRSPKIVGGSTITQQLAKNLFLSGERTLLRKGQEFVLTLMLEAVLDKQRILEIYLNSVEWGSAVFGAEAAARHYYAKAASELSAYEAARLAVLLPRPKYFEKLPNSEYLASRAAVIAARMGAAELP
ncbi:MAG: monofunctional biosynthetic peptidoglycan transglycosylase [Betaproteobacteria bacterium]